jgi:hypothetical protein
MRELPPPVPDPRRSGRVSLKQVVGITFLALLAVPCIGYLQWRVSNTSAVHRLQQAAQARHEPFNLQQLAAAYGEIPAESNSYVALEAIWEREDPEFWRSFKTGERNFPEPRNSNDPTNVLFLNWDRLRLRPGERLSPDALEATTLFIQSQRDHLSQVRAALQRPDFRATIAFDEAYSALLPYLSRMKREATLFRVEAGLAADMAHPDEALDCIEQIGRVGHCLEKDPFLIGQLVRLSISSIALSSAERLLSQTPLDQVQWRRLGGLIASLQATHGLRRALLGERAMLFGFLDSPYKTFRASADPAEDGSPETSASTSASGMRLFSAVGLIAAEKRLSGEAFEELLGRANNLDFATNDQMEEIITNTERQANQFPPKLLTAMIMPSLSRAGQRFASVEAQRLCAEVALQIEFYRLNHQGALPATLSNLPGPVPNDPFDGQPLRYKQTDRGYLVYSVGPDHKDNGGLVELPTKGPLPRERDIGFRVERAVEK